MTRLGPYAEYRENGIDWMPDLPAHWGLRPLWSMFRRVKDRDHPDERMLSVFRDHGVVPKESRQNLNVTAEDRSIYQLVRPGWLVANRMKAWQGSVGISEYQGIVSGHYICFEPNHDEESRYLNWLFRSAAYTDGYALMSRGVRVGQVEIDNDLYRQMAVVVPPCAEQRAIADYLDRETAQIDALIDKQERLMGTLRERRAAVIERAVSGRNSNAPMKPSGLTWTDFVPKHWTVANIRRFAQMRTGHTPSRSVEEYWEGCEIPWMTLADVWQLRDGKTTWVSPDTKSKISELGLANSAAELLPARTVVLSRTASVGFTGIMPVPMATSQDYWNWVCGPALLPEFLVWTFRAMRNDILSLMIGSTHKTIYQPIAASIALAVPPLDEQRRIVDYLNEKTEQIDVLIAKAERFIEVSKERRAALITAAVTGQIDVREHAASSTEQTGVA